MPNTRDACCACGATGEVAATTTIHGGCHLALCRACFALPERRRAFADRFNRALRGASAPGAIRNAIPSAAARPHRHAAD